MLGIRSRHTSITSQHKPGEINRATSFRTFLALCFAFSSILLNSGQAQAVPLDADSVPPLPTVLLGRTAPRPPNKALLDSEPSRYKSIRGKDDVLHGAAIGRGVTGPAFGSQVPSSKKELNSYEEQLCKERPIQCITYVNTSASAIMFQESNASLVKQGRTSADRDDRAQALRHQYWFGALQYAMGYQNAFDWAWAHEMPYYNKTPDSKCDVENNERGSQTASQISTLEQEFMIDLGRAVEKNIRQGVYCVRK